MTLAENLAYRIKTTKPERTLNGVAVQSGVSQSVLYRAVNDATYQPKRENLEKLAKFFGCTVDELFIPVSRIMANETMRRTPGLRELADEAAELICALDERQRQEVLHYLRVAVETKRLLSGADAPEPNDEGHLKSRPHDLQ